MRNAALIICLGLFASSVKGQNILTNGGFEDGNLTGWTASGNLAVESGVPTSQGSYALVFSSTAGPTGVLSQSFGATVGNFYLLSFAYCGTGNDHDEVLTVSITDSAGNNPVFTQYDSALSGSSQYRTYTVLFQASDTAMTIQFKDDSHISTQQDGLLDNIQLTSSPLFSHLGNYVGTDVETLAFAGQSTYIHQTYTAKVHIDEGGRMTALLNPGYVYTVGTINDAGQVTLGGQALSTGSATFHGNDIEFHVTENPIVGDNFNYQGLVLTRSYSLHKVSN
ncbi:MAG: DUF642 domain-containing protein [Chthoniobacteraceae bacterium]|jgi:hypothetical protein